MAQTATPTPIPAPPTANEYTAILQAWQGLGLGLAVMFVLGLLMILGIGVVFYIFRPRTQSEYNANETLRQTLVADIAEERKENSELKHKADEREEKNAENWAAFSDASNRIADQMTRTNDLIEANNKRGQERDDTQVKLATAITTIVEEGSKPLREIAQIINEINVRTTGWDQIIAIIPTLKSKIEALESDAEKHITKPIPAVSEPQPEAT